MEAYEKESVDAVIISKRGAVRIIIMLHRVINVLFNLRWGTKSEKLNIEGHTFDTPEKSLSLCRG